VAHGSRLRHDSGVSIKHRKGRGGARF
jgi:hypothetical protein